MFCLPETNIRTLDHPSKLYYFDRQTEEIPHTLSSLEVWNKIMRRPRPIFKLAFKIRDAIASLFGVKKIKGFSGRKKNTLKKGDKLDFFLVEHAEEKCLVLTERDKHLDVMTCISVQDNSVSITSSVIVHNWFGRLYMLPVGIAHRFIVRGMLKRLKREMV